MSDPSHEIAELFNELVERFRAEGGTHNFSLSERAVWFLVSARCEMDINGFGSIFEQLLSREEVLESIQYLEQVGIPHIADLFREMLSLLEAHGFYGADGQPQFGVIDENVPESVKERFDAIEDEVRRDDILWKIDPQLCSLLGKGSE